MCYHFREQSASLLQVDYTGPPPLWKGQWFIHPDGNLHIFQTWVYLTCPPCPCQYHYWGLTWDPTQHRIRPRDPHEGTKVREVWQWGTQTQGLLVLSYTTSLGSCQIITCWNYLTADDAPWDWGAALHDVVYTLNQQPDHMILGTKGCK